MIKFSVSMTAELYAEDIDDVMKKLGKCLTAAADGELDPDAVAGFEFLPGSVLNITPMEEDSDDE